MAKFQKRLSSNWSIGTHTVNAYKERVDDPALKRKRRNANDIRRVLAQALNKARDDGKDVYLYSNSYMGKSKVRRIYQVRLFHRNYYILTVMHNTISLFTDYQIQNDMKRGGLIFIDDVPFEELINYIHE